jgi:hypothetical protein
MRINCFYYFMCELGVDDRAMFNEVINYAELLNSKEILKPEWLRRNAIYYTLITYMNHTIALFVGMNYDGVAIFVRRAAKELERLINERGFHEKYFDVSEEYLYKITRHLIENQLISEKMAESIPDRYRK